MIAKEYASSPVEQPGTQTRRALSTPDLSLVIIGRAFFKTASKASLSLKKLVTLMSSSLKRTSIS
jgi:hypothetical protein